MKKIKYLILLVLFIPSLVNASECNYYELENYRNGLNNIAFNLSYIEKGQEIEIKSIGTTTSDVDSYKFEIDNMPSGIVASIYQNNINYNYVPSSTYVQSGVIKVYFHSEDCNYDVVKSFEVFIPYYKANKKSNDVWFDGTYENNSTNQNTSIYNTINKHLIIIIVALLLVIVTVFVIQKKRRKIK